MSDAYTGDRPFFYQLKIPFLDENGVFDEAETTHNCNWAYELANWTEPGDGGTIAYNDMQLLVTMWALFWEKMNFYKVLDSSIYVVDDTLMVIYGF